MILIKNITFFLWFYRFLFHIRENKKRIHQFRSLENDQAEQTEIRIAEDIWGKSLCEKAGIRLSVSGLENIPDGPVVFVSNHQSYWDIPVFFAAIPHKQFGFIAKNDLEKLPAFGSWIYDVRSIFIERDDARASLRAFEEGTELLKRGFSFTIFPEGTRSKGSQMGEFKKGSLRLATKAGVPVVPITLNGTYKAFEEKGYVCPTEVDFKIHPSISTKNLSKKESGELAEHVEAIIREGLTEFIPVQNN
ncbi:MAG: lysophospholipid acyltransferase family protein [Eubacteriales bacterium]|nr:lysophospholipid acyltransferase family protein [Eubacteriales bacterium]